jgi:hypothetical protein
LPQFSLRTLIVVMLLGERALAGAIWIARQVNYSAASFLSLAAVAGGKTGAIGCRARAWKKSDE